MNQKHMDKISLKIHKGFLNQGVTLTPSPAPFPPHIPSVQNSDVGNSYLLHWFFHGIVHSKATQHKSSFSLEFFLIFYASGAKWLGWAEERSLSEGNEWEKEVRCRESTAMGIDVGPWVVYVVGEDKLCAYVLTLDWGFFGQEIKDIFIPPSPAIMNFIDPCLLLCAFRVARIFCILFLILVLAALEFPQKAYRHWYHTLGVFQLLDVSFPKSASNHSDLPMPGKSSLSRVESLGKVCMLGNFAVSIASWW